MNEIFIVWFLPTWCGHVCVHVCAKNAKEKMCDEKYYLNNIIQCVPLGEDRQIKMKDRSVETGRV